MRIVLQRVKNASVTIDNCLYSKIDYGYLLLVGISNNDDKSIVEAMAKKVLDLRICEDTNGKMNLSIRDIDGEILSVSQFTLYADCRHGRRPSFDKAGKPEFANELYQYFNQYLSAQFKPVKTGIFQADMKVDLLNDGPVTIILDSEECLPNKK